MKIKKGILAVVFLLTMLLLMFLTSCGKQEDSDFLIPIEETKQETKQETANETKEEAEQERVSMTSNIAEDITGKSYAYALLEEKEQILYLEILDILQNRKEQTVVSSTDTEEVAKVFQCVMNDHPELFDVQGYHYSQQTEGVENEPIIVSGAYSMKAEAAASYREHIENYVKECIAGLPMNADEYTKVKYVYEYLIQNTEYKLGAIENQNICSVFLYKESVCLGYAKAMQYLLNQMDVFCTLVTGTVDTGEEHAWNLVRIDGAFYYVDATWGEALYRITDEQEGISDNLPSINYDYLCVNTEQLLKTHTIDNVVPMPECTSLDANYYVKENAYFIEADEAKIAGLFAKAYEKGNDYVTLKCSSLEVYEEILAEMLDEQKVFAYLRGEAESVLYSNDEKQLTISFWL